MSQSTMGDTWSEPRSVSRARTHPGPGPDYEKAVRVLERCDSSRCLTDFKENVVEALGSVMGYRDVSFFAGPTFHATFSDRQPVVAGRTAAMLPQYVEQWWKHDVFGTPQAVRSLQATGVAAVSELSSRHSLTAAADAYVRHFLMHDWQVENAAAIRLDLFGLHTGLIGIFTSDPHGLDAQDIATLRVLARQLSAVARGIPFVSARHDLAGLTERQREVAYLVAEGFSNAEIAQTLSLAEDSVKKYISRILATTGCHTRMELALMARSGARMRT